MADEGISGGLLGGGAAEAGLQGGMQNEVASASGGNVAGEGAVQNAAPGSGQAWSFLPEGLGGLAEGYDKPETFWADVSRLKDMDRQARAMSGKSPDSFVRDEDWNAFWKAAGRPDKAEDYKLPEAWEAEGMPEEVSRAVNETLKADRGDLAKVAQALGLTNKQAQALHKVYGGLLAEHMQQEAAGSLPTEALLKKVWPEDTQKHLDAAVRGARHAGIGQELDETGLSKNPLVLKLAHALGERLGEAGLPGSGAPDAALPTGQAAREEMYRLIQTEAYRSNDPAAMKKLEALAARVNMR